jgi:hypothetical protein
MKKNDLKCILLSLSLSLYYIHFSLIHHRVNGIKKENRIVNAIMSNCDIKLYSLSLSLSFFLFSFIAYRITLILCVDSFEQQAH